MKSMEKNFADLEYERKRRKARREMFLDQMESPIPWEQLVEQRGPPSPSAGKGRIPYALESMLGVHCLQLFCNLSDPATEDMLYEVECVWRLTGIRLEKEPGERMSLTSAICWKVMDWGGSCLRPSRSIWRGSQGGMAHCHGSITAPEISQR